MGSCVSCKKSSSNHDTLSNKKEPSAPPKSLQDEIITSSDFVIGAQELGPIQPEVALSAYKIFDKNKNGYLTIEETRAAYAYIRRLIDN